jgi:hypothetical protein
MSFDGWRPITARTRPRISSRAVIPCYVSTSRGTVGAEGREGPAAHRLGGCLERRVLQLVAFGLHGVMAELHEHGRDVDLDRAPS